MNKFIFSKLQLSPLSIVCFVYLLSSSAERLSILNGWISCIIGFLILLPFLIILKRHRKSLILGFTCLILIHMSIRCNSSLSLLEEDKLNKILINNSELKLLYGERIGKNTYNGVLFSEGEHYPVLIESDIYTYRSTVKRCDSNSTTKKILDTGEKFTLNTEHKFLLHVENCKIQKDYHFRDSFKLKIFELMRRGNLLNSSVNIGMGLIFGDTSYLDNNFKTASREGGIIHLFAASGLHLGIFLGSLSFLSTRVLKLNYYPGKLVPILFGFGYLYLLNFPVSLSRAYLFAFLWTLGKLLFRNINPLNLLIICSTIISLFQFNSFLEVSFLLSFGAVIGIFYLKKPIDSLLFNNHSNYFTELVTVSLGAGLGTFPFLIFYFHSYSYGSIFLNLLLIPICTLLLPSLYICIIIEFSGIPIVNELMWTFSDILLRLTSKITLDMPESLKFYRNYSTSDNKLILYYLIFIFILVLNFIIKEKFFPKNRDNIFEINNINFKIKNIFSNLLKLFLRFLPIFLYSIFTISFIFFFHYSAYQYNKETQAISKQDPIISHTSYLIEENNHLFLEGSCMYYKKIIKDRFSELYCGMSRSIHINDPSCLKYFLKCKEKPEIFLHRKGNKSNSEILKSFPEIQEAITDFPRSFVEAGIYFYAPHREPIDKLFEFRGKKPGFIYLQFPYKSRDSAGDWNRNRNYLGLDEKWEFRTVQ